jgi:hypothetical protein
MISRPSHGVHFGRALPINPPMMPMQKKTQSVVIENQSPRLPSQMDVEQEEMKILEIEDENMQVLLIKNLDTNEVM